MRTRKGGFTLIELLVVITILVMLMTLLLPAVLRARLLVLGILTKGQVTSLTNACNAYYQIFNAYPGVVENPPTTNGTPAKISGCQNLRLSLFGVARNGTTYDRRYLGPADSIDTYDDTMMRKYEPFWNPKPEAVVRHGDVPSRDSTKDSGYDANIEVFVDYFLSPGRPLLYYRSLPRYVDSNLFQFDDNDVYCSPDKGETSTTWSAVLTGANRKSLAGFWIVSAGIDRVYFTTDDYSNMGN